MSDKRKTLLALKEKLLQDIQYCEDRIVEARDEVKKCSFEDRSSDSDTEFTLEINTGPTVSELRKQQDSLRTSLMATQELSGIEIMQSEVNVLIDAPVIDGEPPVRTSGTWREVLADARADLVPFCISFYVHTSDSTFPAHTYRATRVSPIKATHAQELSRSVIHDTKTPSDAVGMVRSYASAWRARRVSLAKLAKTYPGVLEMEPAEEGGYTIRVPPLLSLVWRLNNSWSPLAPFTHRMKFELDYLDENYVKTISQANKELSDPTIDTEERTRLLSKIIATCLEAKAQNDSQSSENEAKRTIEQEMLPGAKKVKKDSEIMAPPKDLPKKVKNKKSNVRESVPIVKKSVGGDSVASKKKDVEAKVTDKSGKDGEKIAKDKKDANVAKETINIGEDGEKIVKDKKDGNVTKATYKSGKNGEKIAKEAENVKQKDKVHKTQEVNKNTNSVAMKEIKSAGRDGKENVASTRTSNVVTNKNEKDKLLVKKSNGVANGKIVKKVIKSKVINKSTEKIIKNIKKMASEGDAQVELLKKVTNTKIGISNKPGISNVANAKTKPPLKKTSVAITKPKIPEKIAIKIPQKTNLNKPNTGKTKQLKVGNTEKENNSQTSTKSSKIPKKTITSVTDVVMKNALRSSPRTNQPKSKVPGVHKPMGGKAKIVKPVLTNIPRLVSKTKPT